MTSNQHGTNFHAHVSNMSPTPTRYFRSKKLRYFLASLVLCPCEVRIFELIAKLIILDWLESFPLLNSIIDMATYILFRISYTIGRLKSRSVSDAFLADETFRAGCALRA